MLLFSDLHLSPKTFETSMKVLRRVHTEAISRNVPVGFLGDFFDHVYNKGTLPVDILNELLRFFADEWHVPMIMIPGNHDYFDASETEHGLTPFKYASKHITVLDVPTVLDNRLWIPWRRDPVVCKRIIDQYSSGVDVIFGHFDIIGFKLNAKRISTEGLSADIFPEGKPVYTGHYHTPQKFKDIVYLGSPYQLTLSEAEDKKALIVLDSVGNISEKIGIDIGPKQYKWTPEELVQRSKELKPNDRVSVTGEPPIELVRALRTTGTNIEVKRVIKDICTRIKEPASLSESQLLDEYAKLQEIDTNSEAWSILKDHLKTMRPSDVCTSLKSVVPVRMSITGFGPFVGPVNVPLCGQGFTLISGEMTGSSGSNGAGKSMVSAGALLWVLTGLIDGRNQMSFESGGTVLHNGCGPACIRLMGTTDKLPFEIERTLSTSPRKHTITFTLDGVNRTRSTLSATQRAISEEIFGKTFGASELWNWLLRNCCWSQQHVQRFCDASDSQAKQEIQTLANMKLWLSLHNWAKETNKEIFVELKRLEPEVAQAEEQYTRAVERHARNLRLNDEWQKQWQQRISSTNNDIAKTRIAVAQSRVLRAVSPPQKTVLETYKRNLMGARDCRIRLTTKREMLIRTLPKDYKNVRELLPPPDNLDALKTRMEQCRATMSARRVQMTTSRQTYESFQKNSICSACNRPFDHKGSHAEHLKKIKSELQCARVNHASSVKAWQDSASACKTEKDRHNEYDEFIKTTKLLKEIATIREQLSKNDEKDLRQHVLELERAFNKDEQKYTEYKMKLKTFETISNALDALERAKVSIQQEVSPYNTSDKEVSARLQQKRALTLNARKKRLDGLYMKSIIQWTGPRGIQTYIMEHTIKKLAAKTTYWLQRFFGEETYFEAGFDSKERLTRRVVSPGLSGVMSGGQWRRVQLASFLAWKSMESDAFPLLIMDECCTSMDQPGIEVVQETLKDWSQDGPRRTCYFITHEPGQFRDTSVYENHLRIQNKRGRSSLISSRASNKKQRVTVFKA